MKNPTAQRRFVSEDAWFGANGATLKAVTALLLLATTASMVLAASGMEELVLPLLVTTLSILVVGIALSRLFYHLEVEGLPVIERVEE